uniref:Uncharacterized protein n=1 Tax=Leersia perrieri TaxID=77586 RepID=A0A0D9W4Y6_9ORYZ
MADPHLCGRSGQGHNGEHASTGDGGRRSGVVESISFNGGTSGLMTVYTLENLRPFCRFGSTMLINSDESWIRPFQDRQLVLDIPFFWFEKDKDCMLL